MPAAKSFAKSAKRSLTLVVPDLFDRPSGIGRISQTLALACTEWVRAHGAQLAVIALHDTGAQRDLRVCPEDVAYRGHAGDRRRFALDVVRAAVAAPRALVIFGHANFAPLGLATALRRGRYAVVAHGVEAWAKLSPLRELALRQAAEIWPVSRYTAEVVARVHRIPNARIVPVRNCLDPLQPLRSIGPPPPGAPRFLVVSRLTYGDRDKGVDRAIEAFALARARLPEGTTLEIVGDGDDRARLEALARAGTGEGRVVFHGAVADAALDALFVACRAFVLPSRLEGFGLVFAEAMARGRAVIAAAAGATPEVVEDGVTGLLVAFDDRRALADAIVALAEDPSHATQLGVAGRARLDAHFLYPRYAREVAARLDTLLGT